MSLRFFLLLFLALSSDVFCANLANNYWPDGRSTYRFYGSYINGAFRVDPIARNNIMTEMETLQDVTPIRYVNQYQVHQLFSPLPLDSTTFDNSSSRGEAGFPQCKPEFGSCIAPYVSLPPAASPGLIQHELTHNLGYYHEQQRLDRDSYLYIDTTGLSSSEIQFNYAKKGMPFGPFDVASTMLYKNTIISYKSLSALGARNWLYSGPNRYARLKFDDAPSVPMPSKLGLKNSSGVVSVSVIPRAAHEGMWVLEKINDTYFRVFNRSNSQYLAAGMLGNVTFSSAAASAFETNWQIELDTAGRPYLKNRLYGSNGYLKLSSGAAIVTSSGTPIALESLEDDLVTKNLSTLDILAVQVVYGAKLVVRTVNTGSSSFLLSSPDNSVVNTPAFSSIENYVYDKAGQWILRIVEGGDGNQFELVNLITGKYLTSLGGSTMLSTDNTDPSRIWRLASYGDFFRLQNMNTGKYLSVSSSGSLSLQSSTSTAWSFDLLETNIDKFTKLQAGGTLFEIGLANSSGDPVGSKIYAKYANGAFAVDLANQPSNGSLWFFITDGKDYRILNSLSGEILYHDQSNNSMKFAVYSSGFLYQPKALWRIEENNNLSFKIKNVASGNYLNFDASAGKFVGSSYSGVSSNWLLSPTPSSLDPINEQLVLGNSFYFVSWNTTSTTSDDFFVRRGTSAGSVTLDTTISSVDSKWTLNEIEPGKILDFHICKSYRKDNTIDLFPPEFVPTKCLADVGGSISAIDLDAVNEGSPQYFRADTSGFWHIEFYKDYFRIKNRKSGKYLSRKLVGSSTVLELNATPVYANSLWDSAPAAFSPTQSFF